MIPKRPNPQRPDPYRRKIRAARYAALYGMTTQGVNHQIRTNRIAAEQPAGPGTAWYVWLDEDHEGEKAAEERLILEAMERGAA